jgi:R.HinP1I restriction endonuclease
MGYDLTKIEKVLALKIKGSFKSDVQIQVNIFLKELVEVQNISVKLASNEKGFNQLDKR